MNTMFQTNPKIPNNVMNLINRFKTMRNPQMLVEQMLQSNPQVNSLLQAAGGDAEKAFRDLAQQLNVDADEIINALR